MVEGFPFIELWAIAWLQNRHGETVLASRASPGALVVASGIL